MFVHRSNRTEELSRRLAEVVGRPLRSALAQETIVVSSKGIERWLSQELSKRLGVVANTRFPFPRAFIDELLAPFGESDFSRDRIKWAVAALLPDLSEKPVGRALSVYLSQEAPDLAMLDLAEQIARAFDQYTVYRPALVREWERGGGRGWQPELFRAVNARLGAAHLGARTERFLASELSHAVPERVSFFGISSLPPIFLQILGRLSREREVHVFLLTPGPNSRHLLAHSLGGLARDFESLLVREAPHAVIQDAFVEPGRKTMLGVLQSNLLGSAAGAATAVREVARASDTSVLIHSCHGPLREVEVLKDQLLAAFDEDPTLEPHEVAVMAPDIDRYAPLVEAVFGQSPGAPGFIPFRITDRTIRAESNVAETVLRAFDLAGSRMTASAVLDFVQLDPVRRRFELLPEDLPELRRLVSDVAIHWGIDADQREALGQPRRGENTWAFGLGRMLLGHAMPPSDALAETFAGIVPLAVPASDASLVGKLSECCRALFAWNAEAEAARLPREWGALVRGLLSAFVREDEVTTGALRSVRASIDQLVRTAESVSFDRRLGREAWASLLRGALETDKEARRFASGGVTFCALLPMRSVPFRVLYVLGLTDTDFPRRQRSPGFDLIARKPQPGDRSARAEDRQLFLEALLSARDKLVLSYVGRTIHENAELPPSAVVSELVESIESSFSVRRQKAGQLGFEFEVEETARRIQVQHPLKPWDFRYFDGSDPRLSSHVASDAEGARALAGGARGTEPFVKIALRAPEAEPLTIDALARFFEHPSRGLLRGRLGVTLDEEPHLISDREPLALSPLDAYRLGEEHFRRVLEGSAPADGLAWSRGTGLLPFGTPGAVDFAAVMDEVRAVANRASPWLSGGKRDPLEIELDFGETRLSGALRDVTARGQVLVRYGRIRPKTEVFAWIHHLALQASGVVARTALVGRAPADAKTAAFERVFAPIASERARAHLAELIRLRGLGLRAPLSFFPQASKAYVERFLKGDKTPDQIQDKALEAARKSFSDTKSFVADGEDAYVKRLYELVDPFSTNPVPFDETGTLGLPNFASLAMTIFRPLLEASEMVTP